MGDPPINHNPDPNKYPVLNNPQYQGKVDGIQDFGDGHVKVYLKGGTAVDVHDQGNTIHSDVSVHGVSIGEATQDDTYDIRHAKTPNLGGKDKTEWDLDSMQDVVSWLGNTKQYVDKLATSMPEIMDLIGWDASASTLGTFPTAGQLWSTHSALFNSVQQAIRSISQDLQDASEATSEVISHYSTVADRNHADIQQIEKFFTDTAGASTTSSAGSSNQNASNTSGSQSSNGGY
jgi:hypothetical protein